MSYKVGAVLKKDSDTSTYKVIGVKGGKMYTCQIIADNEGKVGKVIDNVEEYVMDSYTCTYPYEASLPDNLFEM